MSGANTALVGAGGAALAAVAGGPLTDVFNDLALALAIMGAGGGMTRGLANKLAWREVARGSVIGALLAVGLGALAPQIVGKMLAVEIQGGTVSVLAALAYIIGLVQDKTISFLLSPQGGK